MKIILLLIPVTLMLVSLGILLFVWAVRNGQYDDLEGPAHRILYDDDEDMIPDDARPDRDNDQKTTDTPASGSASEATEPSPAQHREPPR